MKRAKKSTRPSSSIYRRDLEITLDFDDPRFEVEPSVTENEDVIQCLGLSEGMMNYKWIRLACCKAIERRDDQEKQSVSSGMPGIISPRIRGCRHVVP